LSVKRTIGGWAVETVTLVPLLTTGESPADQPCAVAGVVAAQKRRRARAKGVREKIISMLLCREEGL
jgi:hypothetical protein